MVETLCFKKKKRKGGGGWGWEKMRIINNYNRWQLWCIHCKSKLTFYFGTLTLHIINYGDIIIIMHESCTVFFFIFSIINWTWAQLCLHFRLGLTWAYLGMIRHELALYMWMDFLAWMPFPGIRWPGLSLVNHRFSISKQLKRVISTDFQEITSMYIGLFFPLITSW